MDKDTKEIIQRLISITMTTLFLIFATILWKDASLNSSYAKELYEKNDVSFVEISDGIRLDNAYPVSDEIGKKYEGYKFKVINNSDIDSVYEVSFVNTLPEGYEQLPVELVKYQIIKNGEVFIDVNNLTNNEILFTDEVKEENIYELKLWIDNEATSEIMGKYFSRKIVLI